MKLLINHLNSHEDQTAEKRQIERPENDHVVGYISAMGTSHSWQFVESHGENMWRFERRGQATLHCEEER